LSKKKTLASAQGEKKGKKKIWTEQYKRGKRTAKISWGKDVSCIETLFWKKEKRKKKNP